METPTVIFALAILGILAAASPSPSEAAPSPDAMQPVTPATAAPSAPAAPAPAPQAAEQKNDAVVVISGGIGDNGIAEMEKQQKNYSLKVVFSGEGGIYLSDVDVNINDTSGKMVTHTITQGPVLLARLKPGRYNLTASQNNKIKKVNITVPAKGLKTYQIQMPVSE